MELTFIGLVQLLIGGMIVLAGGLRSAFAFLMISGLMGGSAAINLPALGGSSILPEQFALLFVYLRILAPRGGFVGLVQDAFRENIWLVLFTFYGMAAAIIMPRLFLGVMEVSPMRVIPHSYLFYTLPLEPTNQNITACVYLLGALMIAIAAWITCRLKGGAATLIKTALWISWIHVVLGVLVAVAGDTALNTVFELFRNSSYAQLDSEASGFVRIRGLFPESSSYASFGFGLFVLMAELWFRSIRPAATGAAALALVAILFISTSSTAYVGLLAYLMFFILRAVALPLSMNWHKFKTVMICMFVMGFGTAVLMAAIPELPLAIYDMVLQMTVEKPDSSSGEQRLFWTMQGIDAFFASYGLGIGPGSFRSSSMFTAILGASGVIGAVSFIMYVLQVVQPGRHSTWVGHRDVRLSIGSAFGVAALLSLVPAAINSANVHPSAFFATLAGASLSLRSRKAIRQAEEAGPSSNELNQPIPAGT